MRNWEYYPDQSTPMQFVDLYEKNHDKIHNDEYTVTAHQPRRLLSSKQSPQKSKLNVSLFYQLAHSYYVMIQIHCTRKRPTSDGAKRRSVVRRCKTYTRYSEDLLADAHGFFISTLGGFSTLNPHIFCNWSYLFFIVYSSTLLTIVSSCNDLPRDNG